MIESLENVPLETMHCRKRKTKSSKYLLITYIQQNTSKKKKKKFNKKFEESTFVSLESSIHFDCLSEKF